MPPKSKVTKPKPKPKARAKLISSSKINGEVGGEPASPSSTKRSDAEVKPPVPPPTSHAYNYKGHPETGVQYWLIKSEPTSRIDPKTGQDVKFPLSDLVDLAKPETWDGVRNYEARNNMILMAQGDIALFYHSNCDIPGIVGEVEICESAHVDETQFNPKHKSYDAKSSRTLPKWWCVDVKFRRRLRRKLPLKELQANADSLADFLLLTRGRLSVIPVGYELYEKLVCMENQGEIRDDLDCEIDRLRISVV